MLEPSYYYRHYVQPSEVWCELVVVKEFIDFFHCDSGCSVAWVLITNGNVGYKFGRPTYDPYGHQLAPRTRSARYHSEVGATASMVLNFIDLLSSTASATIMAALLNVRSLRVRRCRKK